MSYRYYPGCTLKDKDRGGKMEQTALASARALGIHIEELEEWQCCGAVYPLASDELITLLSPARTLASAGDDPLVTLCSACHHVLKRTRERLLKDSEAAQKVSEFLEVKSIGKGEVLHFMELLALNPGFEELANQVKKPLEARKVASYYGCLLLRPAKEMKFDNPENPVIMEKFVEALGAEAINYPYRIECCGAYLSVKEKSVAADTAERVYSSATRAGADTIITACPLCLYNLEKVASKDGLKVLYFTELLAEALGLEIDLNGSYNREPESVAGREVPEK